MKMNQENLKKLEQLKNEGLFQRLKDNTSNKPRRNNNESKGIEDRTNQNRNIKEMEVLWNDLGVVEEFSTLFGYITEELSETNKIALLKNEFDSLEYFSQLLEVYSII